MAHIQITDLNSSDTGLLYELTDEELLDINGGSLFNQILGGILIAGGAVLGLTGAGTAVGVALIGAGAAIYAD